MITVSVTGADGFIGKNLCQRLLSQKNVNLLKYTRRNKPSELRGFIDKADIIYHLAGVNRPQSKDAFTVDNIELTRSLVEIIAEAGTSKNKQKTVVFSSSAQASLENEYGSTKRLAELSVLNLRSSIAASVIIYRLPNVFGKWCRPHYNSVVATFCHQIARGLPINIVNPSALLRLAYVDDVVESFIGIMDGRMPECCDDGFAQVQPVYEITVGNLAQMVISFHGARTKFMCDEVGSGLKRCLYATYCSHLPLEDFSYPLAAKRDERGSFVEMLRTPNSGQFSFFTAKPGVKRGGHYHETKVEKFVVVQGKALIRMQHVWTGEVWERTVEGSQPVVIETIPGWSHQIENVGEGELACFVWANENFDQTKPDTYQAECSLCR